MKKLVAMGLAVMAVLSASAVFGADNAEQERARLLQTSYSGYLDSY